MANHLLAERSDVLSAVAAACAAAVGHVGKALKAERFGHFGSELYELGKDVIQLVAVLLEEGSLRR